MKKYCILFLFLFLSACSTQPEGYDSHHRPIQLKDYRGRWLIVNYWADWCGPCLSEMPILNSFYQQHKASVMVLGVNFDGLDDTALNQVAQQRKIDYPLLSQLNNATLAQQDFSVLPISFVFNPEGKLVHILKGPQSKTSLLASI